MPRHSRRLLGIVTGIILLGATIAIAQMSSAGTGRNHPQSATCTTAPAPATTDPTTTDPTSTEAAAANDAHVHNHGTGTGTGTGGGAACQPGGTTTASVPPVQADSPGTSCENSNLEVHDGFQNGNRCVAVDRGEVPTAENAPSLLIVSAPRFVRANRPFEIRISTRNLVRNFFPPAATGGYYKNRSFLTEDGLVSGHVHTAIRLLSTTRAAPDAAPVPAFFKATEDGLGGRTPDTFVVSVPGIATPGLYQIASWCGDASHGVPMAQRANQTPCFDTVRLIVTR
jgi:hypothetical protein